MIQCEIWVCLEPSKIQLSLVISQLKLPVNINVKKLVVERNSFYDKIKYYRRLTSKKSVPVTMSADLEDCQGGDSCPGPFDLKVVLGSVLGAIARHNHRSAYPVAYVVKWVYASQYASVRPIICA